LNAKNNHHYLFIDGLSKWFIILLAADPIPNGIFSINAYAGCLTLPHKFLNHPPTLPQKPGFFGV
jgi:hypothetical protein